MFAHPSQNQLLSALPERDWRQLQPLLEWVELPRGTRLYDAGSALSHVYFPVTAIVSLTETMQSGASAEIAVVGHEGIVGVCAYLGDCVSLSGAVVQSAGFGLRMPAQSIRLAALGSTTLMHELLRYTQVLFSQVAQTSACSRHHALEQQLCRWLLSFLDRSRSEEMALTQDQMAQMLGVRREGVTVAALKLQKAGLIRYGRGRISIVDRVGLEERSCECYAVVREAYDRLAEDKELALRTGTGHPHGQVQCHADRSANA